MNFLKSLFSTDSGGVQTSTLQVQTSSTQPESQSAVSGLLGGILGGTGVGAWLGGASAVYTSIDNMFGGGVSNRLKDTQARIEKYTKEAQSMTKLAGANRWLYRMYSLYNYELLKEWSEPEKMVMDAIIGFESQFDAAESWEKYDVTGVSHAEFRGGMQMTYKQYKESSSLLSGLIGGTDENGEKKPTSPMVMGGLALGVIALFTMGMKKFK